MCGRSPTPGSLKGYIMWTADSAEWCTAKQQLERAFTIALAVDVPLAAVPGTRMAEEVGEEILMLLPSWFEAWFRRENLSRSTLLQGFAGWYRAIRNFGYKEQEWEELMRIFIPAFLGYNKITLAETTKPEVR